MEKKSLVEIAYDVMKNTKTITLDKLWDTVSKKAQLSDEDKKKKIANFYSQLSLDGRFVFLGDNKWSLRDNLKSDKSFFDLSLAYQSMEEESEADDDEDEDEDGEHHDKKDDNQSEDNSNENL